MKTLNQVNLEQNEWSHWHDRAFQAKKLLQPRNFTIPPILKNNTAKTPVVLEIGAGKGKHALSYAKAHLNEHIIAIERTRNKFDAFLKLAQEQNLLNLTPVHADAIPWIVHATAASSITAIYILYPNPEPHNPNQQWLNMPFFEFLLSRLIEGGKIIIASNIETYMDNAERQAREIWQLPTERTQVAANSQRTHFEAKYLARKQTCWQLTMQKPKGYITRFDNWSHQTV